MRAPKSFSGTAAASLATALSSIYIFYVYLYIFRLNRFLVRSVVVVARCRRREIYGENMLCTCICVCVCKVHEYISYARVRGRYARAYVANSFSAFFRRFFFIVLSVFLLGSKLIEKHTFLLVRTFIVFFFARAVFILHFIVCSRL